MNIQTNGNSNTPSFGMGYAVTKNIKRMHWAAELEKNKDQLTRDSKDVLAIFTKGLVGNLDCYAFKSSKYGFINRLQEKFPGITLGAKRLEIFSKRYFFNKYSDYWHNGTLWLRKDKSVTTLLDKTIKELEIKTQQNKYEYLI